MLGWTLLDTLLGGDAEWLTGATDFDLPPDEEPQEPAPEPAALEDVA